MATQCKERRDPTGQKELKTSWYCRSGWWETVRILHKTGHTTTPTCFARGIHNCLEA
ncbi:hypothetical protein ACRRTK_005799 [Alexandromys fortis]